MVAAHHRPGMPSAAICAAPCPFLTSWLPRMASSSVPLSSSGRKRLEHGLGEPRRIASRIHVVAEQQQDVVARGPSELGDGGGGCVESSPLSPMSPATATRSHGWACGGNGITCQVCDGSPTRWVR